MAIEYIPKQTRNTPYDNMVFPRAEWAEFPMAVPVKDGVMQDSPYSAANKLHDVVIVNDEDELARLKAGAATVVSSVLDTSIQRVETEDDVRAELYRKAEQKGVKIDKRWTTDKITAAIAEADQPVL